MSWLWFALRSDAPKGCCACVPAWTPEGVPAGYLAAWERTTDQPDGASKIDARAIDPEGGAGWVSLVLPAETETLPFDDPAVAGALRRVLGLRPSPVFSTLSARDDRWLGSVTGGERLDARLLEDPFGALVQARVLRVGAGFLGLTPALPGPVIQRYGSGNPWPSGRFERSQR